MAHKIVTKKKTSPVLSMRDIEAGYGELTVLRRVSVDVFPGEIVALIGPNGAGKSTILKTAYAIAKKTAGTIMFCGEDVSHLRTHELLGRGLSYVPQGRINFGELTVLDNLKLALESLPKEERTKALANVYKRFPVLEKKQKIYAFGLSGGEQQMLAIARALLQRPKLLLMDEPSLGLSPKLQQELFAIINELGKSGIAILLVEQNAKQAIMIAHRTYLLEQGQVALTGGKEILKDKRIKEVYLGGA